MINSGEEKGRKLDFVNTKRTFLFFVIVRLKRDMCDRLALPSGVSLLTLTLLAALGLW